jgi:hypothetical protein
VRALLPTAVLALCACGGSDSDGAWRPNSAGSAGSGWGGQGGQSAGGTAGQGGQGGAAAGSGGAGGQGGSLPNVVIGFDDLAYDTVITNQYATHATFSSDPGCACAARSDGGFAVSKPNFLFTYYSCTNGAHASVFVDFTKPVSNLSFKAIGVETNGKAATINAITSQGIKTSELTGHGDYNAPVTVDLSEYTGITRLEIVDVLEASGVGFDDFAFAFPE